MLAKLLGYLLSLGSSGVSVCLAFLLGLVSPSLAKAEIVEDFLLGGIQVNEPDHDLWVKALADNGLNTVHATVYARQADWDSGKLWFDEQDEAVISELKAAKRGGLKSVLITRLALDHAWKRNRHMWHGMVYPKDDEQLELWFKTYTDYVLKWAKIAEKEKVDVFVIGSELRAMSATSPASKLPGLHEWYLDQKGAKRDFGLIKKLGSDEKHLIFPGIAQEESVKSFYDERAADWREWATQTSFNQDLSAFNARRAKLLDFWRGLIKKVRKEYSGPLSYAANFDEYQDIAFWGDLDFMGVNAYFKLRDELPLNSLPSRHRSVLREALREGWGRVFSDIEKFQHDSGIKDKPLIFTELGFTFKGDSTLTPWAHGGVQLYGEGKSRRAYLNGEKPVDYQERALAIESLNYAAQRSKIAFKGLLYWKLSTISSHEEIEPFVHILGSGRDSQMSEALRIFRK